MLRRLTGLLSSGASILALLASRGVALLAAARRRGGKPLFALIVGGSVVTVGYLPSAVTSSPGAPPASSTSVHSPFLFAPFVSARAALSLVSNCSSCHQMSAGSLVTKPFSAIPHKTEGWEQCSFCHAPARLAPAPENHKNIPDAICQACHRVSTIPPPSLGHVLWQDTTCSSCHRTSLDLPASHDDRGDLTCALCHEPAKVSPPAVPHTLKTEGLCSSCHAPAQTAPTEPRHAEWGDDLCTTCHEASPSGVPTVPHALDTRQECTFCHVSGPSGRSSALAQD